MSKDTGGPAFPCEHPVIIDEGNIYVPSGMTLRDYFAAKAMQGILAQAGGTAISSIEDDAARATSAAYRIADAMLAERAK